MTEWLVNIHAIQLVFCVRVHGIVSFTKKVFFEIFLQKAINYRRITRNVSMLVDGYFEKSLSTVFPYYVLGLKFIDKKNPKNRINVLT